MNLFAQELTVKSMTALPMDLSASKYVRKDLNGQPCALVKLQLATMGARFEGNVVGSTDYHTNEYWVYMTEGSYMLCIKHPAFLPLTINFRDYDINGLKSKGTYQLTIAKPKDEKELNGNGYLNLKVMPVTSNVFIDGKPQEQTDGKVSILLPYGKHHYKVECPNYVTQEGDVILSRGMRQHTVELISCKDDEENRAVILPFLADYQEAYFLKDIEKISAMLSDDCIILVEGISSLNGEKTKFLNSLTKKEYIDRQKRAFDISRQLINFDHINIKNHPLDSRFYGVSLHYGLRSKTFGDTGYYFFLIENVQDRGPVIRIRVWQAEEAVKEQGDLLGIDDFELPSH